MLVFETERIQYSLESARDRSPALFERLHDDRHDA